MKTALFVSAAALVAVVGSSASAAVTYAGSAGAKAAEAEFSVVGNTLTVKLTNTSTADVLVPSDVLTAVFFNVSGSATSFAPASAVLTAGSYVIQDSAPAGGIVGGEWAYRNDVSEGGPISGTNHGISSTGLGVFGGPSFPGSNLGGPAAVDGLQYGLVSAGDNAATGNGGIMGADGLIHNSVTFTFTGANGFNLSRINCVYFLYGTALNEGGFTGQVVPTPGSSALAVIAGGLIFRRRR